MRAIKDRLKNDFNVSVAEVGDQDVWQSLHIGISAVGSNRPYMDGLLTAEMVDCKTETLKHGPGNLLNPDPI